VLPTITACSEATSAGIDRRAEFTVWLPLQARVAQLHAVPCVSHQ
jgi:hypothetical protein